jgi:prephenate dehydratase
MPEPKLIVFAGPTSQTGLAVNEEFQDIDPKWKDESIWGNMEFDDIRDALVEEAVLAILPIWNSHNGEIHLSHALEMVFQQLVKLHALWPKLIIFECVGKDQIELKDIKKIISVKVARDQCSKFIQDLGATFVKANSTKAAFYKFKSDSSIQAVLCAPGQNKDNFKVLCKNAANPVNFTSFAFLACLESETWDVTSWGSLYDKLNPKTRVYFGVQMPIRSVGFSDDQKTLFNELTDEAETINDIPNILFVTKRDPDKCGLLIEAEHKTLPDDILTDEGYSTEIKIIQDIGEAPSKYADKIYSFLISKFSGCVKHDFIKHRSVKNDTCFFACPPLEIIIHGFEDNVVEPVMRLLINKYFELYNNWIKCTEAQKGFFKKYNKEYLEDGMGFIKFVDIGRTS